MRLHSLALSLAVLHLASACGDDGGTPDAGGDAGLPRECDFHEECSTGACDRGRCVRTQACMERFDCRAVESCADNRCLCREVAITEPPRKLCVPVCSTDNHCGERGQCLDGVCRPYPVDFTGELPGGGPRAALQVGIGMTWLDFPVGVSMAGFGARGGKRTPYQEALGGSDSWFDRPDVRAIVFDDGAEMVVFLRLPMGWTTDFMVAETARKVLDRTGLNLIDHILTNATHSHSQPARFWHLVRGLYFGSFGYDEFQWEIFDRLTTSFAEAIIIALENKQPARFGYTVLENWDPNNRVYRDRRNENDRLPGYDGKDDLMTLMRIDDMDGQPLVVLSHFGMHGTHFNSTVLTNDAPGGVEVVLTQRLQAKYGRGVMGVYVQGNGGDVSPAGDELDHDELEIIQLIGERTWAAIEPALDSIVTTSDVDVRIFSGRVAMDHDILYGPGEFFDRNVECEGAADYFRYGAFQCVGSGDDDDPNTKYEDGRLGCVFAVECLTDGYPIPQIQKTRLSVARIGTLALASMPGEPLSTFGRRLSARVTEAVNGVEHTIVSGYSQDHQFYLMLEDDWFQGGYEPSFGLWGFRMAPYLADKSVEIARELNKPAAERFFDNGFLKPMYWPIAASEKTRVAATETTGDPSEVFEDIPPRVERLQVLSMQWAGGHPGVDQPHVVLERETQGGFELVRTPGGWPYDDRGFEMFVRYEGTCNRRNCENHRWRVDWEDGRGFPLGRYRLKAEGRAVKDGQTVDYAATSRVFELVPSQSLRIYGLERQASNVVGRIVDPAAVVYVPEGERRVAKKVGHRLRSPLMARDVGAPLPTGTPLVVSGRLRAPGGAYSALSGTASTRDLTELREEVQAYEADGTPVLVGRGQRPTTEFTLTSTTFASGATGAWLFELTLTDPLGNRGTLTATVTK